MTHSTSWVARAERACDDWLNDCITFTAFLDRVQAIHNDIRYHEGQQRSEAMTPQERNDYYRGYEKDEFLVGGRF